MASSQTDVCNIACAILGATAINAITDSTPAAIAFNSVWNLERQAELRKHIWKFAIYRAQLVALSAAPVNGPYSAAYPLPAGHLRLLQIGDSNFTYPGVDLSDYRSGPTQDDYVLEGGNILSNLGSPLSLRGIQDIPDVTLWDAAFDDAMGARLAHRCCFRVTNSLQLQVQAAKEYATAIREAYRTAAIETPPTVVADDTWVSTRPVGSGGASTIRYG
jgi:hypothetical protein